MFYRTMKVNESQRFIIGLLVRICKRKLSSKLMVEFLQNPICLILSICLMIINYIVWGIYGKIRMWNPLRKI